MNISLESLATKGVNGLRAAKALGAIDSGVNVFGDDHYGKMVSDLEDAHDLELAQEMELDREGWDQ